MDSGLDPMLSNAARNTARLIEKLAKAAGGRTAWTGIRNNTERDDRFSWWLDVAGVEIEGEQTINGFYRIQIDPTGGAALNYYRGDLMGEPLAAKREAPTTATVTPIDD